MIIAVHRTERCITSCKTSYSGRRFQSNLRQTASSWFHTQLKEEQERVNYCNYKSTYADRQFMHRLDGFELSLFFFLILIINTIGWIIHASHLPIHRVTFSYRYYDRSKP